MQTKVENESLRKELQEKQELLCQASQAMELMENQHKKQNYEAQMIIDDLNHKIEAMSVSWTVQFIKIVFHRFNICSTKWKAWRGLWLRVVGTMTRDFQIFLAPLTQKTLKHSKGWESYKYWAF